MIILRNKYSIIKNYTVYGERCSGTNLLQDCITNTFNIPVTWEYGWKHFFGFCNYSKLNNATNTLFIGIVRNPFDWIQSVFNNPYHIPPKLYASIDTLLTGQWYSLGNYGRENLFDRNFISQQRYSNIIDMRNHKNMYLIENMPKLVHNFMLINYDEWMNNYAFYMEILSKTFNLFHAAYKPDLKPRKIYCTEQKHFDLICRNLNWKYENMLGFYKELYPKNLIV